MKMRATIAVTALLLSAATAQAADSSPSQVSAVPIPAEQIDKAIVQIDSLAAAILEKSRIPGMAVAVVRDGRTVYAKGFGVRKLGEPALVNTDTVFQIASLSKSVTASVVARQVGAGIVAWDTPVVKHLPWFRLKDPWVTSHVTIGDLLSHRSGLPDHGGNSLEDLGFDRRQVLERLRLLPLAPFRISYAYTNFGFTAAAEAVAKASGKDWATLAEEVLYKPLGMNATSSRFADFEKRENRAVNHARIDGAFRAKYQRRPDAQSPAGGVSSSVNDMARWLAMLTQGGRFEGREVIDAKALLQAMTAQTISNHSDALDARPGFYGYGFNVHSTPAGRISIGHSGGFSLGAATNFAVLPSVGIGIVVLTNAAPIGVAETLATQFMDLVQFGKVERDWLAGYSRLLAPQTTPAGSLVGKQKPARPAPAAAFSAYIGDYSNDYYGKAQVIRRNDGLVLKLGPANIEYPLVHWDGGDFTFEPRNENEPDGSVSLATFGMERNSKFRKLTIEYLNEDGMGTFVRK